ncbi:hypothetical protein A0H81_12099 [Grifola frondosa]|uniref:Uncharacterized protein n=1 Tax=Grifola frondosa TaxID=5627 RepID=A0A1C7LSY0_GRIFR|nr:hypothetical protein A0H81_12099 [Grifola frondosa]
MTSALQNPQDILDPQQFVKHLVRNILTSDISGLTFLNEMLFARTTRPPIPCTLTSKTLCFTLFSRECSRAREHVFGSNYYRSDGRVFAELLAFLSSDAVTVERSSNPSFTPKLRGLEFTQLTGCHYGAFADASRHLRGPKFKSHECSSHESFAVYAPSLRRELASVHVAIESGTPEIPSSHLEFNTISATRSIAQPSPGDSTFASWRR